MKYDKLNRVPFSSSSTVLSVSTDVVTETAVVTFIVGVGDNKWCTVPANVTLDTAKEERTPFCQKSRKHMQPSCQVQALGYCLKHF